MNEQAQATQPTETRKKRKYTKRETNPVHAALNEVAKMSPLQMAEFKERFMVLLKEIALKMAEVAK